MRDYQTFCFLDNPKTGSTFIVRFLMIFAREPVREFRRHVPARVKEDGKLYFIAVREPLDSYLSIFNFGGDGGGGIREAVIRAGKGDLYAVGAEGFDEWLQLLLDPAFFASHGPEFKLPFAECGLVSARYRKLACFDFAYAEPAVEHVLRFENLRSDLANLLQNHLAQAFGDLSAALEWIRSKPPINASTRRERSQPFRVRQSTIDRLVEREAPLYTSHYAAAAERLRAGNFDGITIVEG